MTVPHITMQQTATAALVSGSAQTWWAFAVGDRDLLSLAIAIATLVGLVLAAAVQWKKLKARKGFPDTEH